MLRFVQVCFVTARRTHLSSIHKVSYHQSYLNRTMPLDKKIMCLFDVDGTVARHAEVIDPDMETFLLTKVKPKCTVGLVGGSLLQKVSHQMGGADVLHKYDYVFTENGLVGFKNGSQISKESIQKFMGEENLQKLINFSLRYMSELTLPCKRGIFVEFRSGMINLSPIGRSCSMEERRQFVAYDKVHKIRDKFVKVLREKFSPMGLTFSMGGQISIDVFPTGWDKTYCLQYLEEEKFDEIHFFGDRTDPGGNDHELYKDPRVIGHKVTSPEDTKIQVSQLLNL